MSQQHKVIIVPLSIDELEVFKFDALPKSIGEGNVHCPRCGLPAFKNGSTRKYRNSGKRVQKYRCPNGHSFNENTSLEAIYEKYRKQKEILKLILRGETVEAIAAKLNVSKYEVRRVVTMLIDLLGTKKIENIHDEIIVIFMDETGAGARSRCLVSALVCNHIVSYIANGRNFLTLNSALTAVRDAIGNVDGKKILVITDGYEAYVDAVFTVFPNAIHVRQFHSKRGVVYIHFIEGGERRTIVLRWDAFLESSGNVSENTIRKRKWSEKIRKRDNRIPQWVDRVRKIDTPLESSDTVYYYSGFKKHPVRRRSRIGRRWCRSKSKTKRVRRKPKIKLLFKGKLSGLVEKFEAAGEVIDTVRNVFAGRYITSNLAEYVFQFKPWLKTKHGLKSVDYVFVMMLSYVLGTVGNNIRSEEVANHVFGASPIL